MSRLAVAGIVHHSSLLVLMSENRLLDGSEPIAPSALIQPRPSYLVARERTPRDGKLERHGWTHSNVTC